MGPTSEAWVEDIDGEAWVEGPHWLLSRRGTLRAALALLLAIALLFLGYVRLAYGVWSPVEVPTVIDGYHLADEGPVSLADARAWLAAHSHDPRPPLVLEPLLGRLPLSGHGWDGRSVALGSPSALWLRVGPDAYLRYERLPRS